MNKIITTSFWLESFANKINLKLPMYACLIEETKVPFGGPRAFVNISQHLDHVASEIAHVMS